jgi:UDP-GlcNAc:undecaprenyl-phosphate/decaprenyl-phosphate GlcNAc-1-phosphate transferase
LNTYITFGIIFLTTILSLALGPVAIWLAPKLRLVDDPTSAPHKVHFHITPVVGGVILLPAVIIICALTGILRQPPVPAIIISALIIFFFGLWDDYKNLRPVWKILGQLIAAIVLILLGVQIQLFQQNWLNIALTLFWIVGVSNAYNFVDSMDGLAIGLASLAAAFFMLITIESQQSLVSLFSTILLGAGLGVFYYNAPPAKIFLGDSGAQLLGFILGAVAIVYNPLGYSRFASWYIPILLMGVPIFDTTLVVFSRMRRAQPVYRAGKDHTYHRLVKLGLSPNRSVITMHMAALLLGALAFIALDLKPWFGNLIFASVLLIGAIGIIFLDTNAKALDEYNNEPIHTSTD